MKDADVHADVYTHNVDTKVPPNVAEWVICNY